MAARFVHTSTHDIKNSLIFQLSYILIAYSDANRTQAELSKLTGVSVSAISRIKNSRQGGASLDTVLRLADGLDLEYRSVTERVDGRTTHHTYCEQAVEYCKRKGLPIPYRPNRSPTNQRRTVTVKGNKHVS